MCGRKKSQGKKAAFSINSLGKSHKFVWRLYGKCEANRKWTRKKFAFARITQWKTLTFIRIAALTEKAKKNCTSLLVNKGDTNTSDRVHTYSCTQKSAVHVYRVQLWPLTKHWLATANWSRLLILITPIRHRRTNPRNWALIRDWITHWNRSSFAGEMQIDFTFPLNFPCFSSSVWLSARVCVRFNWCGAFGSGYTHLQQQTHFRTWSVLGVPRRIRKYRITCCINWTQAIRIENPFLSCIHNGFIVMHVQCIFFFEKCRKAQKIWRKCICPLHSKYPKAPFSIEMG